MNSKIIFRVYLFLIFLLLLVFTVSADDVNFNFYKDSYKPFETAQVNVTIENINLSRNIDFTNLVLLDANDSSISLAKNVIKVNDKFYVLYFDLPFLEAGQYKVGLKEVHYVKDGVSQIGSFFSNLDIIDGITQIVSVRPAYVYTEILRGQEAHFSLALANKGSDAVSVNMEKEGDFFSLQTTSFSFLPNTSRVINVITSLHNRNNASYNGLIKINYAGGSYTVPFDVLRTDITEQANATPSNFTDESESNVVSGGLSLTTLSDRVLTNLSFDINIGEYYPSGQVVVKNNAGVDLYNLNYYLSGDVTSLLDVQPDSIEFLKDGESAVFLISLNNSYDFVAGTYNGFLNVDSREGASVSVPVFIDVTGESVRNYTNFSTRTSIANTTNASLIEEDEKGNSGVWLLLLIVVIVLLIVLYFFYRKTKTKKAEFESFVDKVKSRRNY